LISRFSQGVGSPASFCPGDKSVSYFKAWTPFTKLFLIAEAYEALLKSEIFAGIQDHHIPGYKGRHLLRPNLEGEVEFVTIMWFDSVDAVRTFAGEDGEIAVVPPKASMLLSRFDARLQHYEAMAEMR
jgi:hypothetical protein